MKRNLQHILDRPTLLKILEETEKEIEKLTCF